MKRVYKYNQFEKRDGSTVQIVKDENGDVVFERDRVEFLIINKLKNIQCKPGN